MAYRFRRSEHVGDGIRRVMREEIESATAGLRDLSDPETAVHEARKSVKKVRALLRLISASPKLAGPLAAANAELRDASRHLSALRDAVVLLSTLDALNQRFAGDPRTACLKRLRTNLLRRRRSVERGGAVKRVTADAAAAVDHAVDGAKDWPSLEPGFEAIAKGLKSAYRKGRAALAEATQHPSDMSLHELRKRVKDHWYHVRLLEPVWTDGLKARGKNLKAIETWLGDDHNLAVLLEIGRQSGDRKPGNDDFESLVADYRKELQESALRQARSMYKEKPGAFVRHLRARWDAWKANEPKKEPGNKPEAKAAPAGSARAATSRRRNGAAA